MNRAEFERRYGRIVAPGDLASMFERFEERAAIREYCGGQARDTAERRALAEVAESATARGTKTAEVTEWTWSDIGR